jgi:formylglycine-generating enzyme required for sulfatase activity
MIPADVASTLLQTGTIADSDFLPGASYRLADGSTFNSSRFIIRELDLGGIKITQVPAGIVPETGPLLLGQSLLGRLESWSMDNRRHVFIVGGSGIPPSHSREPAGGNTAPARATPAVAPPAPSQPSVGGEWRDPVAGIEFVWVPGECYQMGCGSWAGDCHDHEKPVHEVCIKKDSGFWMGKYEVTQGQWKKVSGGSNPSRFNKGDNYPVEEVSWNDVQTWIGKLNGQSRGQWKFRLPTEAEWEYACRSGGKQEKYAGGDDVGSVAWYLANSEGFGGSPNPVGAKARNGLGIYDLSGNVYEWCEDDFSVEAYSKHMMNDPIYREAKPYRVVRGGSFINHPDEVRCASRFSFLASADYTTVGFRLVRDP